MLVEPCGDGGALVGVPVAGDNGIEHEGLRDGAHKLRRHVQIGAEGGGIVEEAIEAIQEPRVGEAR